MPTNAQEWVDRRASRSPSASPGSPSPGRSTRPSACRCRGRCALFEKKFYWDEVYDLVWYRPADLRRARRSTRFVEKPLIGGSIDAVTGGAGLGSRELGRAQNGLVRSYALALAGGLAVLAVVFLAAR